jgi:hypothetical protein
MTPCWGALNHGERRRYKYGAVKERPQGCADSALRYSGRVELCGARGDAERGDLAAA